MPFREKPRFPKRRSVWPFMLGVLIILLCIVLTMIVWVIAMRLKQGDATTRLATDIPMPPGAYANGPGLLTAVAPRPPFNCAEMDIRTATAPVLPDAEDARYPNRVVLSHASRGLLNVLGDGLVGSGYPIAAALAQDHPHVPLESGRLQSCLRKGADVDAAGYDVGYTPLVAAARRNDLAALRLLLKAGANPNRTVRIVRSDVPPNTPAGGYSALHYALAHNNLAAVQALLAAHADPVLANLDETASTTAPALLSATSTTPSTTGTEHSQPPTPMPTGPASSPAVAAAPNGPQLTPLMVAVRDRRMAALRMLLTTDVRQNIDLPGAHEGAGEALTLAARQGSSEAIRLLLRAGAQPNAGGALIAALSWDCHAPVARSASSTAPALAVAAAVDGEADLATPHFDLLVQAGAEVDHAHRFPDSTQADTPLSWAAAHATPACVAQVLRLNPRFSGTDSGSTANRSALCQARSRGDTDGATIVHLLHEAGVEADC